MAERFADILLWTCITVAALLVLSTCDGIRVSVQIASPAAVDARSAAASSIDQ